MNITFPAPLFTAFLIVVLAVAPPVCAVSNELPAQIVAEVGRRKITLQELDGELKLRFGNEMLSFETSDRHLLQQSILEDMVDRELIAQDEGKHAPASITVSDAEVHANYAAKRDVLRAPEEVKLRYIFFAFLHDESDVQVQELAVDVRRRAETDPKSFSQLAKEFSQAPNRARGGNLGYVTRNQLPPEFAERAFALGRGEVSEIFESGGGLNILRVEERRGGELPAFETVEGRLREQILAEKKKKALKDYVAKLRREIKPIVYLR